MHTGHGPRKSVFWAKQVSVRIQIIPNMFSGYNEIKVESIKRFLENPQILIIEGIGCLDCQPEFRFTPKTFSSLHSQLDRIGLDHGRVLTDRTNLALPWAWGVLGATADGCLRTWMLHWNRAYLEFMKSFPFLFFFFSIKVWKNTDEKSGNKTVGVVDKTENLFLDSLWWI